MLHALQLRWTLRLLFSQSALSIALLLKLLFQQLLLPHQLLLLLRQLRLLLCQLLLLLRQLLLQLRQLLPLKLLLSILTLP